jgi:hypothetical protein
VVGYNMFRPTLAIFRYITGIPSVYLNYFLLNVIAQQDASHSPKDIDLVSLRENVERSEGVAPRILNFGTRPSWALSFTLRPL